MIESRIPQPSAALMSALEKADAKLHYSRARHIFYRINFPYTINPESCFGVFGDGDNGGYEWFIWIDGKLENSDQGWGNTEIALFEVMKILAMRELWV